MPAREERGVSNADGINRVYRLFFDAAMKGGVSPLVKLAYKLLGRPIVLGDEVGSLIMLWPDVDMDDTAWQEMREGRTLTHEGFLEVSEEYRKHPVESNKVIVVRGRYLYAGTQAMVHFQYDGKAVGFLSLGYGDEEPSAYDLKVAQILAEALRPELIRLHQRGREREDYLLALLRDGDRSGKTYQLAMTELSRKYPGDYRMLFIDQREGAKTSSPEDIRRRLNRSSANAIAVNWGMSLVVLEYGIPHDGDPDGALLARLGEYPVQTGCSTCFESASLIPDHLVQAQATLEVGRMRNPGGRAYEYRDYAPLQLFSVCAREVSLSVFVHPALRKLADYDAAHGSEPVKTLGLFTFHQANRAKTAHELNVHPNTLAYRLRKIGDIAGIDLNDPRVMAEMAVSILATEFLRLSD